MPSSAVVVTLIADPDRCVSAMPMSRVLSKASARADFVEE
jgi:hypothetical protein